MTPSRWLQTLMVSNEPDAPQAVLVSSADSDTMKKRKQQQNVPGTSTDNLPAEALFDREELRGFAEGTHGRLYDVLGAQRQRVGDTDGFRFSV